MGICRILGLVGSASSIAILVYFISEEGLSSQRANQRTGG